MSLYTQNPFLVKGYIHENASSEATIGSQVNVYSTANKQNEITGEIIGLGARIVEFPLRLCPYPQMPVWGREVTVKVPRENDFLLGEKVEIRLVTGETFLMDFVKSLISPKETLAESGFIKNGADAKKTGLPLSESVFPITPLETSAIEASGLVYLPEKDRYLVISDETPEKKPLLFLMDEHGNVTKEVTIKGLEHINDMEAISSGIDNRIYIACSSSKNKKGEADRSRNLLIRIQPDDDFNFILEHKLDLHDALLTCARSDPEKEWAKFILLAESTSSMDIEGMLYHNDAVYIGFKAPLQSGMATILKIDGAQTLFSAPLESRRLSVWKMFRLQSETGALPEHISDLFYRDDTLYICSVSEKISHHHQSGSLWRMGKDSTAPERLRAFNGLKPEGIAAGNDKTALMICFDQGEKNQSQLTKVLD